MIIPEAILRLANERQYKKLRYTLTVPTTAGAMGEVVWEGLGSEWEEIEIPPVVFSQPEHFLELAVSWQVDKFRENRIIRLDDWEIDRLVNVLVDRFRERNLL